MISGICSLRFAVSQLVLFDRQWLSYTLLQCKCKCRREKEKKVKKVNRKSNAGKGKKER